MLINAQKFIILYKEIKSQSAYKSMAPTIKKDSITDADGDSSKFWCQFMSCYECNDERVSQLCQKTCSIHKESSKNCTLSGE